MPLSVRLPSTGLWVTGLDLHPPGETASLVSDLEELGLGALWLSEGVARDPFVQAAGLLNATRSLVVGTGIAIIWGRHPHFMRSSTRAVLDACPGRFVLGLGTSHARVVGDVLGMPFQRPLAAMRAHLDGLDAPDGLLAMLGSPDPAPVPRILAALGPRALRLARERADGAITYLVTPEHTALAREALGPDRTLIVEQSVVVGTDPDSARTRARAHIAGYLTSHAYRNNWNRLGFTDTDLDSGASDRLVDALVAVGEDQVASRIDAHLAAGADHVCLQALPADPFTIPTRQWQILAPLGKSSAPAH